MSAVIVYDSKYGHTQQYAEWLSRELDISCYNVRELGALDLRSYDTLVFGGPIFMGRLKIARLVNLVAPKLQQKRLVCFTVGMHPKDELYFDRILMKNFSTLALQTVSFFQLRGAVNPQRLSTKDRMLLFGVKHFGKFVTNNHVREALEQSENPQPLTMVNREVLMPLVNTIRDCERAASWRDM